MSHLVYFVVLAIEMDASDDKIKAYFQDPNGRRDLSGLDFRNIGIEGVESITSFLSKW